MIKAMQSRAARGLLRWSQDRLAREAGVSTLTVLNFEAGLTKPIPATLEMIKQALERAGVEFVEKDGKFGAVLNAAKAKRYHHKSEKALWE
jgi:transcriptional regulator with XRE-family HTH domain